MLIQAPNKTRTAARGLLAQTISLMAFYSKGFQNEGLPTGEKTINACADEPPHKYSCYWTNITSISLSFILCGRESSDESQVLPHRISDFWELLLCNQKINLLDQVNRWLGNPKNDPTCCVSWFSGDKRRRGFTFVSPIAILKKKNFHFQKIRRSCIYLKWQPTVKLKQLILF